MPVSDDVLERAQRGDRSACAALLAESYPAVVRMARALTGEAAAADRVVDFVLSRGAALLPAWRRGTMPENWFYHHTLLAARESAASRPPPGPHDDLLVDQDLADPGFVAFVRAVRGLPAQQREAFVLHRGERLTARFLGVTMDCSSSAAENHLNAATAALTRIAGDSIAEYSTALSQAYIALGPPASSVGPAVERYAQAYTRPLRLRRLIRRLILLIVAIAIAWAAWHWRRDLSDWMTPWIRKLSS